MWFGMAKLWYFGLQNWVFSSLSYMPMHGMLKRKICKENKSKKNQNAFNKIASVFLGDVGVIGCTSKVIVPINQLWFCVSVFDFLMSQIFLIWDTCALLLCFTHNTQILCYFWYNASTMWFGYHKEYICWYMLTKLS